MQKTYTRVKKAQEVEVKLTPATQEKNDLQLINSENKMVIITEGVKRGC